MGKSTVFANKQGVTSKNSDATVMSATDVCLTPVGSSQVPIPYLNIAKSGTLDKGSKTVQVDGASAAIDGCCYKSSKGDEAGSGKGVMSGTQGDKAEFANSSFDVKIEGKGVCRNADLMTLNAGNTTGVNRDSSDLPPEPKIPPPPKGAFCFRVVEHISWKNYDPKAKSFKPGDAGNNPIKNRTFKIRMPNGSIQEKTTNDDGVIELPDQDIHAKFDVIFEPEEAKLNNKHYLFHHAVEPLEKILG